MRSKEVEDAINHLKDSYFDELEQEITEKSIDTVLNYISDLEEKVNSIDTQFIHKDKVYEIVEEINKQVDIYNDAVDKFNKLLEGKE